ncbi:CBS domain-containing protein [Amycolatopsis sp. H20-H5]|uniref:CBS domain-containing protein n=1 Tax=Amycolatopsis sp. H20-H5 TaxID=3046309 RepID=UPI002DBF1457|nr:CBS domain-containing protein [Amycolatopsis sp. H20-H5]MEC3982232.1 CBS domain-containing protein [Amycolatopsis sp. H20-H5]
MRISEVMSTPVVSASPTMTAEAAAVLMTDNRVTTLPVVDSGGSLLGVLSEADLIGARYLSEPRGCGDPDTGTMLDGHPTAGSLMRRPGPTARPSGKLTELAAIMIDQRLRSVPVLDDGHVVGMVTWQDLLVGLSKPRPAVPIS